MTSRLPVTGIRRALLRWYDAHKRNYPWRRTRDPYRIWLAEIMLQQTRIDVVVPAYRRFLRQFPTLTRLARAEEESVLAAWSGLGYYSRARALHRAARVLLESGRRQFPATMEGARALPGVGPYTAAAVLSIAYGRPHAAVDGNVVRVLSRLACLARPDSRGEPHRSLAENLLSKRRPGDWNQALMELGQTLCTPRNPRCEDCPLAKHCAARKRNATDRYPAPQNRRKAERVHVRMTIVRDNTHRLLLERGAFPYLDHLWLPPIQVGVGESPSGKNRRSLGSFRHAILHRSFEVEVCEEILTARQMERGAQTICRSGGESRVFEWNEIDEIGRSSLLTKAMELLPRIKG